MSRIASHKTVVTQTDCRTGWIVRCGCGFRLIVRRPEEAQKIRREHDETTEY